MPPTPFFSTRWPRPRSDFKAVGIRQQHGPTWDWWIYGATSPDGIHWKWREDPFYKKNSANSANACIRDGDVYRLYVRMWAGGHCCAGERIVGYTQSARFGGFRDPEQILKLAPGNVQYVQLYNPAAAKLSNDLYLMFPSGLAADGTAAVYAAFSRDGKQFRQLGHAPILPLGKSFDSKCIYVGPGAIPGKEPDTYWFYYLGMPVPHDDNKPTNVRSGGGYGRFLLRVAC